MMLVDFHDADNASPPFYALTVADAGLPDGSEGEVIMRVPHSPKGLRILARMATLINGEVPWWAEEGQ